MEKILDWLKACPCASTCSASAVLVAAIGGIDFFTGVHVSVGIFYLVPVSLTSWCMGKRGGFAFSLLSMIAWFLAEAAARPHGFSEPAVYWNAVVRLGYFLSVMYLVAAVAGMLERERRMARIDPLTGARNSRAFFEALEVEADRARRNRHALTLVYIDLDNFKAVNDTYGHNRGSLLLRTVTETVIANLRPWDIVARLGGDEFAILMPETDASQAVSVVSRIQERLSEVMRRENLSVTASLGVASFLSPPDSSEEMVRRADELMYAAKRQGKNRWESREFGADGPQAGTVA